MSEYDTMLSEAFWPDDLNIVTSPLAGIRQLDTSSIIDATIVLHNFDVDRQIATIWWNSEHGEWLVNFSKDGGYSE